MTLPLALGGLAAFRQFIPYKTTPRAGSTWKQDKKPVNWRDGSVHDAHDPAIWLDYETAEKFGHVGFVITDADPFFVLDIDDCLLPTGEWSPLATELCTLFSGAAVEVSISGRGLHIFGTGKPPRGFGNRNDALGIELYNKLRFVALGTGAVGNCMQDCTAALAEVVSRYFTHKGDDAIVLSEVDWTSKPRADWKGSTNDEELLKRALKSNSIASVFGQKANFANLFNNDVDVLSVAYPKADGGIDLSSVDAALAQHLAFWTGCNCDRMLALMRRSNLVREKWEREDYLRRTILKAISQQRQVCQDKSPELVVNTGKVEVIDAPIYLNPEMQIAYFNNCVYVASEKKIITPGGKSYDKPTFDMMWGNGCHFILDNEGRKITDSPWECFQKSKAIVFPKVTRTHFNPKVESGLVWQEGEELVVNSYWPIKTPRMSGNPEPFITHLKKLFPDQRDREIMISYLAAVVQYKGVKFKWAPLIQGTRGNGKTLLSRILTECVGFAHTHWPRAREFAESKFNAWQDGKIFIAVEDVYVPAGKLDMLEELKPMITGDFAEIRAMHTDGVTKRVCCNYILNTNHKSAIPMTADNRGICVFYTPQQRVADLAKWGMDNEYFVNLHAWLQRDGYAIVHDWLANYSIRAEFNPATECIRAPTTTSTNEAVGLGKGTVEQEISAAIAEGKMGFRGGWVSGYYLDLLLGDLGLRRSISRIKRREIMDDLGYIPHPALRNGQCNNPVEPDGCRPIMFCGIDNERLLALGGSGAIAQDYKTSQLSDVTPLSLVGS